MRRPNRKEIALSLAITLPLLLTILVYAAHQPAVPSVRGFSHHPTDNQPFFWFPLTDITSQVNRCSVLLPPDHTFPIYIANSEGKTVASLNPGLTDTGVNWATGLKPETSDRQSLEGYQIAESPSNLGRFETNDGTSVRFVLTDGDLAAGVVLTTPDCPPDSPLYPVNLRGLK